MRSFALLLLSLLLPLLASAQTDSVYKYWVALTDKGGCAYTLDHPEDYLSARALERRQRQSIAVDSLDLPVSEDYILRLEALGFHVQNRSKWLNGVVLFTADSARAAVLDTLPFVASWSLCDHSTASLHDIVLDDAGQPHVPVYFDSAYSDEYYLCGTNQINQLHGRSLHRAGYEGQGLVIGVCDDGFPGVDTIRLFDSLRLQGRLLAARDFVWDGGNPYSVDGHGTAVLSTLASCIPGSYVGTAPKASYVLCRTENALSETPLEMYNWVSAAEYLDSLGADVITTSLGYYKFDDTTIHFPLDGHSAPITIGSETAFSRGMLVVNAAGNNGYYDPPYLNAPADGEHVLTVGAVDIMGEVTSFSSPGPTDDGRIKPDVMALGKDVLISGVRGYIRSGSGTSFSCPIMAGMMTCLWQRFPGWTPQQLCDTIRSWGDRADHPDNSYGYGIPDFARAMGSTAAAIEEPSAVKPAFFVFPNPSRGTVRLSIESAEENCMVIVSDMAGRIVQKRSVRAGSTLRLQLSAGIYLITMTTSSSTFSRRVIVR